MKSIVFAIIFSMISGISGTIMPILPTGGWLREPVNLIWGTIYGFGWFAAGFIRDVRSPNVQTFGSLIWPLLVFLSTIVIIRFVLLHDFPGKAAIVTIFLLSFVCVFPQAFISQTWLRYVPTYSAFLSVVY